MQLELQKKEDRLVALLSGELDHHAAGDLRQRIDTAALTCHCPQLVLDFSGITFMDSSGIGLIMGRYRLQKARGGTLRIQGAGTRLERMIKLAGMDKLPIWNTAERNEKL